VPQLRIPLPFRGPTKGQAELETRGCTVGECIRAAGVRHPGLEELLLGADGNFHRYVTIFVNGEEIGRSALDTPLEEDDQLEILAAIAGG
jgi:sulfur carrier protein ThiS